MDRIFVLMSRSTYMEKGNGVGDWGTCGAVLTHEEAEIWLKMGTAYEDRKYDEVYIMSVSPPKTVDF